MVDTESYIQKSLRLKLVRRDFRNPRRRKRKMENGRVVIHPIAAVLCCIL